MKCRKCLTAQAEFYVAARDRGQIGFCYRCADESGILSVLRRVESVIHGYTGDGSTPLDPGFPIHVAESCRTCGTTLREFERNLLFGCADCSHLFVSLICNFISVETGVDVDQLLLYRSTMPQSYKLKQKIGTFQRQLDEFISKEDYRRAAKKRDEIQKIEDLLRERRRKSLSVMSRRKKKVEYAANEELAELLKRGGGAADEQLAPWMETRVEVRRNFAEFLFPNRMDEVHQAFLKEYIFKGMPEKYLHGLKVIEFCELNPFEKKVVEHRTVRRKLSKNSVVVMDGVSDFSFIFNDEDHFCVVYRAKSECAGFPLEVSEFLNKFQLKVDFAFNPRFGFLTTSPRNLGSGARVSAILHLPFSIHAGQIFLYQSEAERRKLNFDSFSGFSIERHGFFRVTERSVFGRTEHEQAAAVFDMAKWLSDRELESREHLIKKDFGYVEKLTQRLIRQGETLLRGSYQDVLRLVSCLELGIQAGLIEWEGYSRSRMLSTLTSPFIQYADGCRYTINECEFRRAEIFSEMVQGSVRSVE